MMESNGSSRRHSHFAFNDTSELRALLVDEEQCLSIFADEDKTWALRSVWGQGVLS